MASREVVKAEVNALVTETTERVGLVAKGTGVLWGVELIDQLVVSGGLDRFGVVPHDVPGLMGICTAPFLHANWAHLVGNTMAFIPLAFLASGRKKADFWVVSVVAAVAAGLGAWVFGAPGTVHIGASGVIFGYLGFLMGRGVWERKLGTMFLSAMVTFFFGGMLWGVLPIVAGVGISWQSHLFGWLGGLLVARVLGKALAQRKGR